MAAEGQGRPGNDSACQSGRPPYQWLMPLAPWERADRLELVLVSLTAQTWPAERLVVSVDGTLPDGLRAVLERSGLPLLLVEAPSWQGTGVTLARGLLACTTPWVLRTDADDLSHPERAERQLRHLIGDPGLAILGTQLGECGGRGGQVSTRSVPTTAAGIRARMRWRNPFNHPTVALRREAVLAVGNYRACPGFEDWDLWLRLAATGAAFANLPEVLVTASVGEAHLARRHGPAYGCREARFLLRCARERLLPTGQVLLLLMLRLPLRLLPARLLAALMSCLRSGVGVEHR